MHQNLFADKITGQQRSFGSRITPLMEERLAGFLPPVSNSWISTLLAGVMNSRVYKSASECSRVFREIVGDGNHVPNNEAFVNYFGKTLVPLRIAEGKSVISNSHVRSSNSWILTEDGEHFGSALAMFSLKWEVENGVALYSILGSANSRGDSKGPFTRIRILSILAESTRSLRRADLVEQLGLDGATVLKHLRALSKLGFINYDSVSVETPGWAKHWWMKDKDPADAVSNEKVRHFDLRLVIVNLLHGTNDGMDYFGIAVETGQNPIDVLEVLADLRKEGFVFRDWRSGDKQSDASILESCPFVESYLIGLENILSDGSLVNEMHSLRNQVRLFAPRAASQYFPYSIASKSRPAAESMANLLKMVSDYEKKNGFGPRTMEIKAAGFNKYLTPATNSGLLQRSKSGKASNYTITSAGKKRI